MSCLTWLHLSDWHQKGKEFERIKVRDALVTDVRERKNISSDLTKIDFVVFSGDLAYHGTPEEYRTAATEFLTPLLEAADVATDRLFIVPGNHDLEWAGLEVLPSDLLQRLDSPQRVNEWLTNERKRRALLEPMAAFSESVIEYLGKDTAGLEPAYGYLRVFDVGDKRVAVLGLNSAWLSARHKEFKGDKEEVNDYGHLILGEPQLHAALSKASDADVRIAVLHHPLDWLTTTDNLAEKSLIRGRLSKECHFILHGHEHEPNVTVPRGTVGDSVMISAGSCYDRLEPKASRYANGYNFVHLDFARTRGTVYLRRYEDRQGWIRDTGTTGDATPGFSAFDLPRELCGTRLETTKTPSLEATKLGPHTYLERERVVLEGYLNALIRDNADLEPGGIKQTNVQVVLPLSEIYVGLEAERDRPDVDRRVMQEELDEIKKRLEREEDPKEREKQYQIWAQQARTLQQALELAGPREELSNIIQHHRQVVILGDPGSGKTTLLRYLTLRFAQAILTEPNRIFQTYDLWHEESVWRLPDLGPVRLPILLRISHFAEARQKEPDLPLTEYLPRYFAGLQVPYCDELGLLLRRLLDAGRCLVLLDGLDEIIDATDRRNIATTIGQFAGVFGEAGLPDWFKMVLRPLPEVEQDPRPSQQKDDVQVGEDEDTAQLDKLLPEEVRAEWRKKFRRSQRGTRARQLAWEILREARFSHAGNRFLVTSRIAGYHFAGVPGDFEHYTIRRMSVEDIGLFLEKWCPAVERRIAESPDATQIQQRARREIEGILKAVGSTPGVRRMAENPLLLRILAIIHRNEAHLPQRRVELYETATVTLLRDWHLERGTKGVAIDEVKAMSLLGPVALYIHDNRASGFLSKGETEQMLGTILGREKGEDKENPSLETREAVHNFLDTVRQHSGLFVERGEGLYGFMHLTFQEYFTARQLVSSSTHARQRILERLHLPRWREPVLLAVGSLSKQFYDDTYDLLKAILDARSDYEAMLHRDLLFAAACVGDSVNVAPVLRQGIAARLLSLYCDRRHAGRYDLLQKQIKDALLALCNDQGDLAVELALVDCVAQSRTTAALGCALEVVEWLKPRTSAVAVALAERTDLSALPQGHQILREVRSRLVTGNGTGPSITGWDNYREDEVMALFLGAMWRSDWKEYLPVSLALSENVCSAADESMQSLSMYRAMKSAELVIQRFNEKELSRLDVEHWEELSSLIEKVWKSAPSHSQVEVATEELVRDIVALSHTQDELHAVGTRLGELLEAKRPRQLQASAKGSSHSIEVAVARFARAIRVIQQDLQDFDLSVLLQRIGDSLLKDASFSHSLAKIIATVASNLAQPGALHEEALLENVKLLQSALCNALVNTLRITDDAQQYKEAAFFLAFRSNKSSHRVNQNSSEYLFRQQAISILRSDLARDSVQRCSWALDVLRDSKVREAYNITGADSALLLNLLGGPADQAAVALEVLFGLGYSPELMTWCWFVLRNSDHPLRGAICERLDVLKEVKGTAPFLSLLREGLGDKVLRPFAFELARKITWEGTQTFVQALDWLNGDDKEIRHLAALLLAERGDPLEVPKGAFLEGTLEKSKAIRPSASHGIAWNELRRDPQFIRLLGALLLHGWDEALTQLCLGESAQKYLRGKYYGGISRYRRTSLRQEEVIRTLMGEAKYGGSMIPLFKQATSRLTQLEQTTAMGKLKPLPTESHITKIQEELLQQMAELAATQGTALPFQVDAHVIAVGLGIEVISLPSLAQALSEALGSAEFEDRMIAFDLLSDREFLREEMKDQLWQRIRTGELNVNETLAAIGLLLRVKVKPTGFQLWLRSLISDDNSQPVSVWIRHALTIQGTEPYASPAALATLLLNSDNGDSSIAAALALLGADLWVSLTSALVEAAQSQDDRLRMKGRRLLASLSTKLPTDGSTGAIELLLRCTMDAKEDGYLATVLSDALGNVEFVQTDLINRWLAAADNKDLDESRVARRGLGWIYEVSEDVMTQLCSMLSGQESPRVRHAIVKVVSEIMRNMARFRRFPTTLTALRTVLSDPETDVRRTAAFALQYSEGEGAWDVAHELLDRAQEDTDIRNRLQALRSVGRVLQVARGFREIDVSKEALIRWLLDKASLYVKGDLETALRLPLFENATDPEAVLDLLTHLEHVGQPNETVAQLKLFPEWAQLLENARSEWQTRHYWMAKLPYLPAAISQVEAFLGSPVEALRRVAARALASLYERDEDRPARLRAILSDNIAVLTAMTDAISDRDVWIDESKYGMPSPHPAAVKQIAGWVEAQPREEREHLIEIMLKTLERTSTKLEQDDDENDPTMEEPWSLSRVLMAVLAELSERLTYRAFVRHWSLQQVLSLFIRLSKDPNSYNTRRFAMRAIGNLQQFTAQVAEVFFDACQDVSTVYRETRAAVTKFKVFEAASLEKLTEAARRPSITVAYHAAILLGELGISRSEELGRKGRKLIADELVRILEEPLAERLVYDFSDSTDGKRVGPLYDVIYEALVRVVAGPDAPAPLLEATPTSM